MMSSIARGSGHRTDAPFRHGGELDGAGMMKPQDVADAVLFVVSRPRTHRILEVAFRPVTEAPGA